jgi:putative chitinase
MITGDNLRKFNSKLLPGMAAIYAASLDAVLPLAEINTSPIRVRHFMAQLAHESAGFRGLTESLKYTNAQHLLDTFSNVQTLDHAEHLIAQGQEAIGNWVYANKLGNGNAASGDGYRFRGRGFIMNTGRANYAEVAKYTELSTVNNPDLLSTPDVAAQAAAMFWKTRKINLAADADDIEAVTRLVNGTKMEGLDARKARYQVAEEIWPDIEAQSDTH